MTVSYRKKTTKKGKTWYRIRLLKGKIILREVVTRDANKASFVLDAFAIQCENYDMKEENLI